MPAQNNGKDNFGGLESPYFSGEFFAECESEEKFQPYPGIASESPFQSLLQADLYESPSYEEELDEFEYEDEEYEDECGCDELFDSRNEGEYGKQYYNNELFFHEDSSTNADGWKGTPEQIAFRDKVLAAHIKRGGTPKQDLSKQELSSVPGTTIKMANVAAIAAGQLLKAANDSLAKAQVTGDEDALHTIRLTATSGYRGSDIQRKLWIRYFTAKDGYYDKTVKYRTKLADGAHSEQAIKYMLRRKKDGGFGLGGRIAAPGYSNHQSGIAIDFWQERKKGHEISNKSNENDRAKWRKTWFHQWLKNNAVYFGFYPIETEEWHWEYRKENEMTASPSTTSVASPSTNHSSYLGGKLWVFKSSSTSTGVAIFCSQSVLLKPEVDILLYAHGLLIDGCRPKRIPYGFVTDLPFNFGNIVTDSGRPVVLVIPYLNWKSPEGKSAFGEGREKWHKLGHPKNLNALIAEVLVEVGRIQSITPPSLHNLIIAGHSRAYDFLEPLAYSRADPQMQQGALAKLSQVWAFDTTYSGNVNNWLDWLSINRRLIIKIFYRSYGYKKDKVTGRSIKIILGTKRIGDAFYKHRNDRLTVLPVDEGHCSVPSTRLPELLRLSTIDKEREVDEAFWESYESEQDFNFEYELSGGNGNLLSFDQSSYISEPDKDFEWADEELVYDDYFETRRENLNSYEDSLVEDNLEFEDCACEALVENGLEFEDSNYELNIPEINQLFGDDEESYESEIHAEQYVYQQEAVNRYNQEPPAGLIRFFQLVLNVAEGENLARDGNLGQITHAAIKRFRKKYDLGEENIVDEKVQIALVQRALEVIKQQSIFPRFGQWDDKTEQSVIDFKAKYGLGFNKIIDSATRDALVAALGQRKGYPDRSSVVAPKIRNTIIPEAAAYRKFRLTTYHVVEQKNFPTGTNQIPIYDDNKHIIAEGSPEFFANLSLEGTALLDDGRLVNVTGKMVSVSHDDYAAVLSYHRRAYVKKPETSSKYSGIEVSNDRVVKAFAFHVVPEERRGVGYGTLRKIPLVPFRTLAADIGVKRRHDKNWKGKGGLVPIGTRVYIKEYDGLQLPDNTIHDGWFTVNDTGGGIFGAHFDVFVGTQSLRKQVKLPSIGHVWFSGIEHRIIPNYSYGL